MILYYYSLEYFINVLYTMGFPNHIIMDFSFKKNNYLLPYWVFKFTNANQKKPLFLDDVNLNTLVQPKHSNNWTSFLKQTLTKPTKTLLSNTLLFENIGGSTNLNSANHSQSNYLNENLVNINFLRYERLYTKLKYSRSPAYDIVSGGAAALLAGFLGFLISEKFGFELVDSGDFYYLFMYIVFGVFLLKPLLYISNVNTSILTTLSYRNIINFFIKIILLTVTTIKTLIL